jgi:FkbM family methyltransferase
MRVFVDVGAHYGETLDVALDPRWAFDRVYSLEPSSAAYAVLSRYRDPRLKTERVGLSNHAGKTKLYGAGQLGGSVYADKKQKFLGKSETETIRLVKATQWFRSNIPDDAEVYLKLNCEGSEVDILDDLLDSGEMRKVKSTYVDFDVRKVPSQAHRADEIVTRLRRAGVDWISTASLLAAGNKGVRQWLARASPVSSAPLHKRLSHALRSYAPPSERMKHLVGAVLPRGVYWWLGRRYGRLARTGE